MTGDEAAADRDRRLDEALTVIARQAKASNLDRTEDVSSVLDELPDAAPERVDQAARSAHQLAGSAGTFGQQRASELARQLESFLADRTATHDAQLIARARHDLAELRRSLQSP